MVLSNAERARRCREKKKAAGLGDIMKKKDRMRKQIARSKMSLTDLTHLRIRQRENLRRFRAKGKDQPVSKKPSSSSFSSKQAKGKALKKVRKTLPIAKDKQIELVRHIAQDLSIVDSPKSYERNSSSIPIDIKEKVKEFFYRYDITYQTPGRRDSIVIKQDGVKHKVQKRYLLYSLNEVYQLFINENANLKISCSSFKALRPMNILYKSSTPHNVCVCLYHENVYLLLQTLKMHLHGLSNIELNSFTKLLVCDDSLESCMFGECNQCSNNFEYQISKNMIDPNKIVTWTQWSISSAGRMEKVEETGSIKACVNILKSKINHFLFHVFVKQKQSEYFRFLQDNITDEVGVLQVDYAENFSIVEQNEIQSAHWSKRQLSIFTSHLWAKTTNYSMALVSNDPSHNKWTVSTSLDIILSRIKSMVPSMKELFVFNDGSASQFKQRYLMKYITHLAERYDLKFSWNFFATSHGKGNNISLLSVKMQKV